jgi:Na+/phosphate symporter
MLLTLFQSSIQLPGISIVLSALVCVIGALVYAFAANPKLSEIGRLAFFAGLLAFLLLFK